MATLFLNEKKIDEERLFMCGYLFANPVIYGMIEIQSDNLYFPAFSDENIYNMTSRTKWQVL